MRKKHIKSVSYVFVGFFIAQLFARICDFLIINNFISSEIQFFRFWQVFGNLVSNSWLVFSLFFIVFFVGEIFLSSIRKIKTQLETSSMQFGNFVLLLANLFLCNELYNNKSFQEKTEYLAEHFLGFLLFLIIMVMLVLLSQVLKRAGKARLALKNNPQSFISNSLSYVNDKEPDNQNDLDQNNVQNDILRTDYPLFYILNSFKNYYLLKKTEKHKKRAVLYQVKTEEKTKAYIEKSKQKYARKKEEYSKKAENERIGSSSKFTYIFIGLLDILLTIGIFYKNKDGKTFLYGLIECLQDFFNNTSNALPKFENPILNFFIDFGILFFIAFAFFAIDFLVYICSKVVFQIFKNTQDDDHYISALTMRLKSFFFGITDGAIRLLIFFPDFLELIESILLNTDTDAFVKKYFSNHNSQPNENSSQGSDDKNDRY